MCQCLLADSIFRSIVELSIFLSSYYYDYVKTIWQCRMYHATFLFLLMLYFRYSVQTTNDNTTGIIRKFNLVKFLHLSLMSSSFNIIIKFSSFFLWVVCGFSLFFSSFYFSFFYVIFAHLITLSGHNFAINKTRLNIT